MSDPQSHSSYNSCFRGCPARMVLDRIADKWTVLLLKLLSRQPMRFNALLREVDGISQKMLSQTLKSLERDGFVCRTVYPTTPITVEYAITPLGMTLAQAVKHMVQWAEAHVEEVAAAQQAYDQRTARVAELRESTGALTGAP